MVGLLLASPRAQAQVRWDVGVSGGAAARFLSSRPAGEGEASAGPSFEAEGHIVVFPLVRVGAYLHFDESPIAGNGFDVTRDVVAGGLDLRVGSPWPHGNARVYLRAGIGEAGVGVPSRTAFGGERVPGSGGRFTEVPVALGVAYRPYSPFWLTAEAGARVGFAFGGAAYGAGGSVGEDAAAVYGCVGVMWGR
jgi:hypothetical protein